MEKPWEKFTLPEVTFGFPNHSRALDRYLLENKQQVSTWLTMMSYCRLQIVCQILCISFGTLPSISGGGGGGMSPPPPTISGGGGGGIIIMECPPSLDAPLGALTGPPGSGGGGGAITGGAIIGGGTICGALARLPL